MREGVAVIPHQVVQLLQVAGVLYTARDYDSLRRTLLQGAARVRRLLLDPPC